MKAPTPCVLTLFLGLALHLEVHGGQAELVTVLGGQLPLLQAVAHTQPPAHRGHLLVELLPCDLVVEAQPAELDLHTGRRRRRNVTIFYSEPKCSRCSKKHL